MKREWAMMLGCAVLMLPSMALAQAVMKTPPAEEITAMDTDLAGTDKAKQDAAADKLKTWVKAGYVSDGVWRKWVPSLLKAGRQQDIADITLEGVLHRPDPVAIYTMMTSRYEALSALKKNEEALQAAKSYFNVAQMSASSKGVDAVATMLGKAHPEDAEIVKKFKQEQADATAGKTAPGETVMKGIKVDATLYEGALKLYKVKTLFRDRIGFGDLLLAADKGAEAEALFRELYQTAEGADQLTQATEGIAKAIRTQDGNPVRAAAWWKNMQAELASQAAATQPKPPAAATRPAAASRPVATRPATRPAQAMP